MEYKDQFELSFIQRTQSLLRDYRGPFDITLLLNCLLGLLIVPRETSFERIPVDPISFLEEWGITPNSIKCLGKKTLKNEFPDTVRGMVYNMRNAVAHFNIAPIQGSDIVKAISFTDQSGFYAEIDVHELRVFVEKLANYLDQQIKG